MTPGGLKSQDVRNFACTKALGPSHGVKWYIEKNFIVVA